MIEEPEIAIDDQPTNGPEPSAPPNGDAAPPPHREEERHARSYHVRSTVEFLLVLVMGILVVRAFAAEAYIVPTGSMAPTLLGMHRDILCPNCGKRFSL